MSDRQSKEEKVVQLRK